MRPAPLSPWSWGGTGLLASLLAARAAQLAASQRWSGSGRDRCSMARGLLLSDAQGCAPRERLHGRGARGFCCPERRNGGGSGAPRAGGSTAGSRVARSAACCLRGSGVRRPGIAGPRYRRGALQRGPWFRGDACAQARLEDLSGARRLHQHLPRAVAAQLAVQLTCAAVPTPPPPSGACRRSAVKKQKLLPPWWAVG